MKPDNIRTLILTAIAPVCVGYAQAASTSVGGALESTGQGLTEAGTGLLQAPSRVANVRNEDLPMMGKDVQDFLRSNMAISGSLSGTRASDSLPGGSDFGSRLTFGLRYFF